MRRKGEKGEGKLGGLIVLVAGGGPGARRLERGASYLDHYDFKDKVNEICRTPTYKAKTATRAS